MRPPRASRLGATPPMMTRGSLLVVLVASCGASADGTSVTLPDAGAGIGFDDLQYSSTLHRVLAPAARSGKLDLVDPSSLAVDSVSGFSAASAYSGGHDEGVTSV